MLILLQAFACAVLHVLRRQASATNLLSEAMESRRGNEPAAGSPPTAAEATAGAGTGPSDATAGVSGGGGGSGETPAGELFEPGGRNSGSRSTPELLLPDPLGMQRLSVLEVAVHTEKLQAQLRTLAGVCWCDLAPCDGPPRNPGVDLVYLKVSHTLQLRCWQGQQWAM